MDSEGMKVFQDAALSQAFPAATAFIEQGKPLSNIYFLTEGIVKLVMKGPRKEKILRYFTSNNYIGVASILELEVSPYSAVTLTDSDFCVIDFKLFLRLAQRSPDFSCRLISYLTQSGLSQYERCVNLYQHNLYGKVANTLIELSLTVYRSPSFLYSPLELTAYIGSSRENVSRVISQLRQENVIAMEGNLIKLLDMDRLMRIGASC